MKLADLEPLDGLDPNYFGGELVFIDIEKRPSKEPDFVELDSSY